MRRIDEDIARGKFQNLYLLYGTEEYLKNQYKKKLIDALVNEGDTMNFSVFKNDKAKDKSIVDIAETVPFMAKMVGPEGNQYRVILIEESGFGTISASKDKAGGKKGDSSKKDAADLILDYLSEIPESTIFIFVESKIDKKYRLFKRADERQRAIEITMPNESVLQKWVGARLNANGKKMRADAWNRFYAMTNNSMNNMDMEIEKLISYTGDREQITIDDVNAICIESMDVIIYKLADAIAEKDLMKTFDVYHQFLSARIEPKAVLGEIIKLYNRMKVIKAMTLEGKSNDDIARVIGVQPYYVKVNSSRAKRFSMEEIDSLLAEAADYNFKMNRGLIEEKMAVELLMMKYAGGR